jgi:hypothetical protein
MYLPEKTSECAYNALKLSFRDFGARSSKLGKRDRNCLFVAAYLWRETSHQVNYNFSAEICDFHVQSIGTTFRCHHAYAPPGDKKIREAGIEQI